MGRSCSVPNCRSNYGSKSGSGHITMYSLPKGDTEKSLELRNKWLKYINRDNWTPGKSSCVCILHFSEELLLREDVVTKSDGTLVRMARDRIGLKEGAYPTIFDSQPSLLSDELPVPAPSIGSGKKRAKKQEASGPGKDKWMASDTIHSFKDFKESCKEKVDQTWATFFFEDSVHFVKYDPLSFSTDICLQVKHDLQFLVYCHSVPLPQEQFPFMATQKLFLCDRWLKFKTLLAQLKHWNVKERSLEMCVKDASSMVLSCISKVKCKVCDEFCGGVCTDDNYENEERIIVWKKLVFIQEQLDLLLSKQPFFSPETLLWAFKLNLDSPSGYGNLRDTHVLTLPHPMFLRNMSLKLSEPNQISLKTSHIKYLTEKCSKLSESEKLVNVISDKIYVKSQSKYKDGCVEGQMTNCNDGATAVQTFMLSSVYSKNRDIVGLFPFKNENANQLLEYINQVLSVLHQAGYTVLSLISGNYPIDRLAFTHFGMGQLSVTVENPVVPHKYIFTMFDSNHLLKNIRDNWLDDDSEDQTFVYPDLDDFTLRELASVKLVKDVHIKEASNFVKKEAALFQKALYPSSTEKEILPYATKLFDDKTIAALKKTNKAPGTVKFLQVINTWWKVVNFKNVKETGPYQRPIDSKIHDGYQFLVKFERWLKAWENLEVLRPNPKAKGKYPLRKLTTETFSALSHTTRAMIKICDELLDLDKNKHVLLGKFQSDNFLGRFGMYQQLSGSDHHVSVQQILESKKKSLSLLKFKSATNGTLEIADFIESCSLSVESEVDDLIDGTFQSVICDSDCIDISTEQIEALIYIGGYAGEKALESIECSLCKEFLLDSNKQLSLAHLPYNVRDYLRSIDRRSLIYPTEFTMNICLSAFKVFQTLIGDAYEEGFMASSSQEKILMKLVMERLHILDIILDISCECGVSMSSLAQKCCISLTNIFLKNYVKLHNDSLRLMVSNKRKRALNAF